MFCEKVWNVWDQHPKIREKELLDFIQKILWKVVHVVYERL